MPTLDAPIGTSPRKLVNPRERFLYAGLVVVSMAVYGGLVAATLAKPELGTTILLYAFFLWFLTVFAHGLALGRVRGNAVRVSERQFPLLHRLVASHARKLGLNSAPRGETSSAQ